MPMFKNVRAWIYGLFAAMIGGGASAVSSGVSGMVVAPETFNLSGGLGKTLKLMGATAVVGAATHVVTYLKQSPVPPPGDDTTFIKKEEAGTNTPAPK